MDRTGQNETRIADNGHHQKPPSIDPRSRADRSFDERMARIAAAAVAKEKSLTEGFVYFVACGPYLKIGYSFRPRDRARGMATENPYDCELIGLLVGGTILEAEIHKRYAANRHRREWFHLTPALRAEIEAMCGDWSELAIRRRGDPKSLIDAPLRKLWY